MIIVEMIFQLFRFFSRLKLDFFYRNYVRTDIDSFNDTEKTEISDLSHILNIFSLIHP